MTSQAQEVFKVIYESSNKTLNDPKEDVNVRKIALFKVDALTYLNTKALEEMGDSTRDITTEVMARLIAQRDSQAYYMYDYVNLLMTEFARANNKKEKSNIIKLFHDTSITNPLYNEPDRNLVMAYANREDFLTQFSLDTDWIKACAEVRRKLRERQ